MVLLKFHVDNNNNRSRSFSLIFYIMDVIQHIHLNIKNANVTYFYVIFLLLFTVILNYNIALKVHFHFFSAYNNLQYMITLKSTKKRTIFQILNLKKKKRKLSLLFAITIKDGNDRMAKTLCHLFIPWCFFHCD